MIAVPRPSNDTERVKAVRARRRAVSGDNPDLSDLVDAAAAGCKTPIAAAGLVDRDEVAYPVVHGITMSTLPRDASFCAYTILAQDAFVVPDASRDSRFAGLPHVKHAPHVRYYAAAPILLPGGLAIGTICVLDLRPREPAPGELDLLRALARVAARRLVPLATGTRPQPQISDKTTRSRAQLASILAHELGSPLTAIRFSSYVLERHATSHPEKSAVRVICSAAERMQRMLGRLFEVQQLQGGDGLRLSRNPADLAEVCRL